MPEACSRFCISGHRRGSVGWFEKQTVKLNDMQSEKSSCTFDVLEDAFKLSSHSVQFEAPEIKAVYVLCVGVHLNRRRVQHGWSEFKTDP